MGIERYLVLDALVGVLSQRLVRRVCSACSEPLQATPVELAWLGLSGPVTLRRGRGCNLCDGSGLQGRTALVELFFPDAALVDALRAGASSAALEELARTRGYRTLNENGRRLVLGGMTTMAEVQRVSRGHFLTTEERAGI
ncbi:MAG: hypothetical protein EXS08_01085 [Planctomycetes bacterium]|nr:hypothetical protein [Planctomycetota bacterium]